MSTAQASHVPADLAPTGPTALAADVAPIRSHRRLRSLTPLERTAAALAAAIGTGAAVASYVGLHSLAEQTGALPRPLAPLLPLVIDCKALHSAICMWAARRHGASDFSNRLVWRSRIQVWAYVALSMVGNAAHVWDHGPLAAAIAALIPFTMYLALEELLRAFAPNPDHGEPEPATRRDADTAEPAAVPGPQALPATIADNGQAPTNTQRVHRWCEHRQAAGLPLTVSDAVTDTGVPASTVRYAIKRLNAKR